MKPERSIRTIGMEPLQFFSQNKEYFLRLRRITLSEVMPPCFEDVSVLIYVEGGRGVINVNGLDIAVRRGTCCMMQTYHLFEIVPDDAEPLELVLMANDCALSSYLVFTRVSPKEGDMLFYDCPVIALEENAITQLECIIKRFEAEQEINDESSKIVRIALLGQIERLLSYSRKNTKFTPPLGWSILTFITKYNSQPLTAREVARNFDISEAAMNRELRKITSYNFNQLLNRARINTVCAMMPLDGLSLRFIANYIGFASENSFYRAFRTWKGMNPQEYRDTVPKAIWGYTDKSMSDLPWAIVNYICKNFRSPITIKSVAEELYISEGSVNATLLQYCGVNFQEQLTLHRILYARGLLLTTNMPICDIAEESGFGGVNTFYRLFKKKYGVSASEYRLTREGLNNAR